MLQAVSKSHVKSKSYWYPGTIGHHVVEYGFLHFKMLLLYLVCISNFHLGNLNSHRLILFQLCHFGNDSFILFCTTKAIYVVPCKKLSIHYNDVKMGSNLQPHHCLLNRLFGRRSKKTSHFRVTGLCAGNSPGTGEFPAQLASNAENVYSWWRHHELCA